ncbi:MULTISPECIES: indolepyruvate oxidoreductase subunit beta family protein [unclassified Sphingomonas]|uniref:indolepyruvate oxidoreductase subunit beta family protein n=1 Tax=unclassified Sphingomonas TaxID=196159 RepID=UPI0009264ADB|nr:MULTISPECIES: indolepyruvate oxidoreductase subunit beta family protein [unclassified Sphingomonas]MBN8846635.1 indolepyruvate oxidoreductase subunit beta family protein [Sphingomonas sp.]OJV34241.1 MAG: indolepyruvate oxidoreductase subunit B [Sphingomonas sp. 67-36]
MDLPFPLDRDRITIAILALGGEGGGVLADWIQEVAARNGYITQGTSVPGVAQRTGSTVYYIEMIRRGVEGANRPEPVLAMMPVPGDVDIVIASELMEAGRAILRGFVSEDRTTLIGSTHRVYAIAEKAAMGDGTGAGARILDAAERRSHRFIGFDMAAAASASGSVISSVMFGALAASESLPFPRDAFEEAIRHGGKAIESNLKGFELGFDRARDGDPAAAAPAGPPAPTTEAGRALLARIEAELPESARPIAIEGVRRLMDYQDRAYADLYLSRLAPIAALDDDGRMTSEAARHLALWMAYEDTIRVADLKVRATRSARVAKEVRLAPGQVMRVTEYMHPRLREVCETMPAAIGTFILRSPRLSRWLGPLFRRGRHVETTGLRWFLALRLLVSLRTIRRSTLRYREEQARIEDWLAFVQDTARNDQEAATELLRCQQLIKGYSDTFERGLANFETIMREARSFAGQPDAADRIRLLREAAFADDDGKALGCALASDAA